jgi:RNA polymerase sigma factor (sigma-70 family)
MRKNTSNKNNVSRKPPRARFIAKLMQYMAQEYGVFAATTQRKQHPHRKKATGINKKFADQIAQFKEYQTNPTKRKFDKLFNDNLGIVNFTINRWFSHQALSPKRDDMVQEGSIGLMSAIRMFNPDLGVKFSPYAILWVRQAIVKYILTDKNVKLPIPLMNAIKKCKDDPEGFELDQADPEKAKTKGFKEMMTRYKVQRFDMSLDEELPGRFENNGTAQTYKDLLVTNIDNSYSGSVCDGTGAPFLTGGASGVSYIGDAGAFTTYEFDSDSAKEYADYVNVLTKLSKKDIVVVALRYGFSEDDAVVFADMLQAMERDHETANDFSGLRQFAPLEKRTGKGGSKPNKRKYITRKEEAAADFRTISGIVKDLGFTKVNHATARNIVNSRLYDIAECMNAKRNASEPEETKKLTEDQIKSIILTSPAFHERFAEVLKGSYTYLLNMKKEKESTTHHEI